MTKSQFFAPSCRLLKLLHPNSNYMIQLFFHYMYINGTHPYTEDVTFAGEIKHPPLQLIYSTMKWMSFMHLGGGFPSRNAVNSASDLAGCDMGAVWEPPLMVAKDRISPYTCVHPPTWRRKENWKTWSLRSLIFNLSHLQFQLVCGMIICEPVSSRTNFCKARLFSASASLPIPPVKTWFQLGTSLNLDLRCNFNCYFHNCK